MSEKKTVRRSVAVALGIICILLIAIVAYFSVTGISAQNSYTNLQNQNKQLQTWLAGNETLLDQMQADNANLTKQVKDQETIISQLQSNITSLQNEIVSANSTIISLEARVIFNGITYSTLPTPYDSDFIGYFTLLSKNESDPNIDLGMLWSNELFWLLTPDEPLPPAQDYELTNGSTPLMMIDPDPYGSVLINAWLYSQIPTNLTEFTMPQFVTPNPLWTYTANEPIPQNATILLQP